MPQMRAPLIDVDSLSIDYAGSPALSGVTLSIGAGEIVTVVGPNGSGKSTLLRAILGILPPASGKIKRASGLRIGYVPQKLALDPSLPMTVDRFLSIPRRIAQTDRADALARVGVPHVAQRQISALSGGEFQRVLLARALLTRPDILILDEPTQGLDQTGMVAFYRLIETVRQDTGVAVLLVSHDIHVVMGATDRVICLNGHVCCEGQPEDVMAAPEYKALFGGADGALALYTHDHDHTHDHVH